MGPNRNEIACRQNITSVRPRRRIAQKKMKKITSTLSLRPGPHIELEVGRAEPLSLSPGVTVFSAQYEVSSDHNQHTWMPRTRKANASQ